MRTQFSLRAGIGRVTFLTEGMPDLTVYGYDYGCPTTFQTQADSANGRGFDEFSLGNLFIDLLVGAAIVAFIVAVSEFSRGNEVSRTAAGMARRRADALSGPSRPGKIWVGDTLRHRVA